MEIDLIIERLENTIRWQMISFLACSNMLVLISSMAKYEPSKLWAVSAVGYFIGTLASAICACMSSRLLKASKSLQKSEIAAWRLECKLDTLSDKINK